MNSIRKEHNVKLDRAYIAFKERMFNGCDEIRKNTKGGPVESHIRFSEGAWKSYEEYISTFLDMSPDLVLSKNPIKKYWVLRKPDLE